jgi:hypothetical protein
VPKPPSCTNFTSYNIAPPTQPTLCTNFTSYNIAPPISRTNFTSYNIAPPNKTPSCTNFTSYDIASPPITVNNTSQVKWEQYLPNVVRPLQVNTMQKIQPPPPPSISGLQQPNTPHSHIRISGVYSAIPDLGPLSQPRLHSHNTDPYRGTQYHSATSPNFTEPSFQNQNNFSLSNLQQGPPLVPDYCNFYSPEYRTSQNSGDLSQYAGFPVNIANTPQFFL